MKRQGDLLIIEVQFIPPKASKLNSLILAEGEKTGHLHELTDGEVFMNNDDLFFKVNDGAQVTLTHPEHDALIFIPGKYKVVRQREYEPGGWRHVQD